MDKKNTTSEFSLSAMVDLLSDDDKFAAKLDELKNHTERSSRALEQATEQQHRAAERHALAEKILAQAEGRLREIEERERAVGGLEEREHKAGDLIAREDAIRRGAEQLAREREELQADRATFAAERDEHSARVEELRKLVQ